MTKNLPATRNSSALSTAVNGDYDPFADDKEDVGGYQGQFLNFSGKTGEFTFGEDDDEIEPGTVAYVNVEGVSRGWICWDDGEVVDETMTLWLDGPPPSKRDLEDHGPFEDEQDGWKQQIIIPLYIPSEDDTFVLKVASKSGYRNLVSFFQKDYGKVWKKKIGKDGLPQVPEISLDSDFFKAKDKKIGKVYFPVLSITGWHDFTAVAHMLGDSTDGGDDPSDYEDEEEEDVPVTKSKPAKAVEKPKRTRKSKVEDDDEADAAVEEDEEPAPRRTRKSPAPTNVKSKDADDDTEEDVTEDEEEEEEAPAPRRTRKSSGVTHAQPQDADEDEEEGKPQRRARRGRNI